MDGLQGIVKEGQKLKSAFASTNRNKSIPSQKSDRFLMSCPEWRSECEVGNLQVEMNQQKWSAIVGETDIGQAIAAWPF